MKHYILSSLLLLCSLAANSQIKVSGIVFSNTDREVLIGATVLNKSIEDGGTITDIDGNFSINCKSLPVTLEISYVGMETKIVEVKSPKDIPLKIYLSETQSQLEEVVVIGYGTVKKATLPVLSLE